jgi:hypothetical protein
LPQEGKFRELRFREAMIRGLATREKGRGSWASGKRGLKEFGVRETTSRHQIEGHQGSKNTRSFASGKYGYEDGGGQQEAKNLRELDHVRKLERGVCRGYKEGKEHQGRYDRQIRAL